VFVLTYSSQNVPVSWRLRNYCNERSHFIFTGLHSSRVIFNSAKE